MTTEDYIESLTRLKNSFESRKDYWYEQRGDVYFVFTEMIDFLEEEIKTISTKRMLE